MSVAFTLSVFVRVLILSAFLLMGLVIIAGAVVAAGSCEINSCKGGGKMSACWAGIKREAHAKRKHCKQLVIGSGVSSYAMALSLPGACVKSTAVISIHRPYRLKGYETVAIDSTPHRFYFDRIPNAAVRYFRERGGMHRNGSSNASSLIGVPASRTGIRICRGV